MSDIAAPRMNIVNLAHGGRAIAVGLFAEVAGTTASPDHAIAIAVISVVGGFAVMLVQIVVKDLLTRHRPQHPDHAEEQAELNQILIDQLRDTNDRLHDAHDEIDRLRRRK